MLNIFGEFIAGFILLMLLIVALAVFLFVFWILMIIDCVKRDFKNENIAYVQNWLNNGL